MQRLPVLFLFFLVACSSNERSLIGNWKTTKVSMHDHISKSTFIIYDRDNQDSVKSFLLDKYLHQSGSMPDDYKNYASELRQKLDKDFIKYENSKMILETDSSFFMESFGLIIPDTEPGWHFGDTLAGKWSSGKNATLKFDFGNIGINHPFFFKINKLTYDSLFISMTNENFEDPYLDIEFARQ